MLARGRLYNVVAKNIGAGVHQMHLELTNPMTTLVFRTPSVLDLRALTTFLFTQRAG